MTTDALDDTTQATTQATTPEPGPATADKAPAGTPSPEAGHQGDDADLNVLDLGDDDGEGDDAADADIAEQPTVRSIGPPEGAGEEEVDAWRAEYGIPDRPDGYQAPSVQGVDWNNEALAPVLQAAHEHNIPQAAVEATLARYAAQVLRQREQLSQRDANEKQASRETLLERWGDHHAERIKVAREGARVLPKALRAMLEEARTPDGRRIAHTPELAQALFEIGRLRTRKGTTPVPPSDDQRLAQITDVMNTDIDRYQREGLDKEYLSLMRKRDASQTRTPGTLTAAEAQEEAELVQMMQTDIDAYAHRPYRGSGRPAADRLLELRRKRAGEAA